MLTESANVLAVLRNQLSDSIQAVFLGDVSMGLAWIGQLGGLVRQEGPRHGTKRGILLKTPDEKAAGFALNALLSGASCKQEQGFQFDQPRRAFTAQRRPIETENTNRFPPSITDSLNILPVKEEMLAWFVNRGIQQARRIAAIGKMIPL
jgi:hypothetical protein